jgi:hypothetical protein
VPKYVVRRASVVALAAASPLLAQDARPVRANTSPSGRRIVECVGQRVDSIYITTEAPTVASLQRVPAIAAIARQVHAVTRPEIVRRYLLLERGDACSELRRAESERILRAQPFIAESAISVVANDSGGVDLEVLTTDETAIVFGAAVRAKSPVFSSVLFGNANIGGQGVFGAMNWRYGEGFRSAVSGRVTDNQFMGEAMVGTLEAERAERGGTWRAELMRPYYTDLQRLAWHSQAGMSKTWVELRQPDGLRPAVMLTRNYFDIGALGRIGSPGRLTLLGASITGDDEVSGNRLTVGDTGVVTDVGPVPGIYVPHRVARVNLLIGIRNLSFTRRIGLDALTAVEDVPLGVQVGGLIGHTVNALGSRDDDTFASSDLFLGVRTRMGIGRLQMRAEARRLQGSDIWDGLLVSSRFTNITQRSAWHQYMMRVDWSTTHRQRRPFQLLLGVPEAGIRGFEQSQLAGAHRVVFHFDDRYVIGRPFNLADAGLAWFADIGRQWAGDVPFGTTTPIKGSVGISVLGAIPIRSNRIWRADLALPVGSGAGSRVTVTFSNYDRSTVLYREPNDVNDAREPTVPRSIFAWP